MSLTDFNTQWRADNRILEIEGITMGMKGTKTDKDTANTENFANISNKPPTNPKTT